MNYKGFADSGSIELGENWTVIVGRNNSGKTSLLECFGLGQFVNKPHRHLEQNPNLPRNPNSVVEVSATVAIGELERIFLSAGFSQADVPAHPVHRTRDWIDTNFLGAQSHNFFLRKIGDNGTLTSPYPSHGLFVSDQNQTQHCFHLSPAADRQSWQISGGPYHQGTDTLPEVAARVLLSNTYVFRPERRVNARSPNEGELVLQPDAANLPSALHFLYNTNRRQFDELVGLVQQVLPEIIMIDAPPEGGSVHIRVWNSGFNEMRSDLAIGLEECGTGVGQVLAILFVVVTATSDKLIVIDEPNSYLHPGASRVLMSILRSQHRHQFIVTTHSPEIISALEPDKLVVIRWKDGRSQALSYDGSELSGIRMAFDEVGVRLADVFGYDQVVWLEGATEAKCFPMLVEAERTQLPAGVAFVALSDTGSVEGRKAGAVWRAYRKLSQRSSFVPETVAIGLDREGKDETFRQKLIDESGGLIRFLPRRTYENYLIHPEAIVAMMQSIDEQRTIQVGDVETWISENRFNAKYYSGSSVKVPSTDAEKSRWHETVDAPKLLHDLIGQVSELTQDFKGNKVQYSSELTKWLLAHDREHLSELIDHARAFLSAPKK